MRWAIGARAKEDRIACPWLLKKSDDPGAEFPDDPGDQVMAVAERQGATPSDVPDVELSRRATRAAAAPSSRSIRSWKLTDPALQLAVAGRLAFVVHRFLL